MRGSTAPAPSVEVVHAHGRHRTRAFRARAPFDLVFANILLGPLERSAPRPIARLLAPDGARRAVGPAAGAGECGARRLSRAGLALERRIALDGWVTLVLARGASRRWPLPRRRRPIECRHVRGSIPVVRRCRPSARPARRASRRLRTELARRGLDGFIVPRADRHQNEYVPAARRAARLAHRLHRLGRRGDRARRSARRCSSTAATRCRCATRSTPRCSPIEHLVEAPPDDLARSEPARRRESSATTRGCTPSKAPSDWPRPARRRARRWSRSSANPIDAIWTDRPAPPLGAVVLHDLRFAGETRDREAGAHPRRDRQAQGRRAGGLRPACGRLDLQHPRRRRRAHAAAARLRDRAARRAGRRSISTAASSQRRCAARSKRSPTCASPTDFAARSRGARRRQGKACGSTRRPPPMRSRGSIAAAGGKVVARRRSDRADEGGEERRRDRRRPRRASARRRRGDALPRLVRRARRRAASSPRSTPSRRWKASAATPGCSRTSRSRPSPAPAPNGAIVHYRVTRKTNRTIVPASCS